MSFWLLSSLIAESSAAPGSLPESTIDELWRSYMQLPWYYSIPIGVALIAIVVGPLALLMCKVTARAWLETRGTKHAEGDGLEQQPPS